MVPPSNAINYVINDIICDGRSFIMLPLMMSLMTSVMAGKFKYGVKKILAFFDNTQDWLG